jgi:hypothetical protein
MGNGCHLCPPSGCKQLLQPEAEFGKAQAATFGNWLEHVSLCDFGSFVFIPENFWHGSTDVCLR